MCHLTQCNKHVHNTYLDKHISVDIHTHTSALKVSNVTATTSSTFTPQLCEVNVLDVAVLSVVR